MRISLILAALLVASPAFAGKDDAEWNPPARYDRPYIGMLSVQYLPQKQAIAACKALLGKAKASMEQRGCSMRRKHSCTVIVIDKTFKGATPKAVLRHELGHCNGWKAHHPD